MFIPDPGIAQIAGTIKNYGINPIFVDLNLPENTFSAFLNLVRVERPDIIGFKFFDTGFQGIINLAHIVKKDFPKCCLIAAGPHVTLFREHVFHQTPDFDFLVIGEGELAIIDIIEYLEGIRKKEDIVNVIYQSGGEKIQTIRRLVSDLDTLASPDWTVFPIQRYFPIILLNDHRFCPQRCSYCSHNYLWGYDYSTPGSVHPYNPFIRSKSLSRICEETKRAIYNLGVKIFGFTDSIPIRQRLIDWARILIDNKEKVYWTSFSMVNQFSLEDLELLARSGCRSLWIGVENANENLLGKMGKKHTREQVLQTFQNLHKCGIVGVAGFMIGFPGETSESIDQTKSLIQNLSSSINIISPFILDPGSPIALSPSSYDITLMDDWECRIILRDNLNEFEIPYYKYNGIPNDQLWRQFEKLSNYSRWNSDRAISESENAVVLSAALGIPMNIFVSRVNEAIISPDTKAMNRIIESVWKATS